MKLYFKIADCQVILSVKKLFFNVILFVLFLYFTTLQKKSRNGDPCKILHSVHSLLIKNFCILLKFSICIIRSDKIIILDLCSSKEQCRVNKISLSKSPIMIQYKIKHSLK